MDQISTLPGEIPVLPKLFQPEIEDIKERILVRIRPDLERIETEMNRLLTTSVPLISVVGRYILRSGGKRLRPLLMILSARLCGYRGNRDVPLSVVFEFLHAASLLHDDVVDHAELRRSKPAANTIWGNPAVVLVGDFLYSKAILMTVGYDNMRILEVLSQATTLMSEGEVLQMVRSDDLEVEEKEYLEIITRKTAVLISAACHIGAIFGGGGPEKEAALRSFGLSLGLAFQLIDDALDYMGSPNELGKPVGNDLREGKATLPLICALMNGRSAEKSRLREIFSEEEITREAFDEIRNLVIQSGGIEYTQRLAMEYVQKAKAALHIFPSNPTKTLLCDMADYVIYRRV